MTKDELWAKFVRKNPALLASSVTFTTSGARKFFDRTFDIALEDGEPDPPTRNGNDMPDFFKQFLHRKP
jgi:hypothetical protein